MGNIVVRLEKKEGHLLSEYSVAETETEEFDKEFQYKEKLELPGQLFP